MEYVARPPVPALGFLVDDLYYLAGTPPYPRLTIPPMPSALVIINLAAPFRVTHPGGTEDFADGCVWATPSSWTTFEYPRYTRSVGVHLKPWGLAPLTGVPSGRLGVPVSVEAVWGSSVKELAGRLDEGATPGVMLDILEEALLERVRPVAGLGLVRETSRQIVRSSGRLSIAKLSEDAGVSTTHLAGRFKELVGITPKRLARTYRFAEVVRSIDPYAEADWAELACRAGYHDQPHFIHELRQFTGLTPTAYLELRRRFAVEHPDSALDAGLLPTV